MSERSSLGSFLPRALHALRLRGPLKDDPTAHILYVLVLALAIWYAVLSAILLPLYPQFGIRLSIAVLQEVVTLSALVLLRLGFFRQASWVYLAGTWAFVTVTMAFRGGIHGTSLIYYVALPVLATWLLGYRAALLTAGLCLSGALILTCLELAGVNLTRMIPVTPMATWGNLVQVTLISVVPVSQILKRLQDSLAQSRRIQEELQEYKECLEQQVQERTREVVEARDQALAANRAKSVFLANMSHELRTPLNAILGFSDIVSKDPNLSDQQRRDLEIVERSGEHLLDLIDDVLDMAKIEAAGITVHSASFDLHALLNETVTMLRVRAEAKNLELLLDVSSQVPPFVRSDSGKLRQVLANLVGNAVKYTEAGSVVVRVDAQRHGPEQLVAIFQVEDTGIGIAPEDQARIFDPFVQAGNQSTRQGTGLGLAISRSFVHCLGGTLQVESELGRGSQFRVEVPVERAEAIGVKSGTNALPQVVRLEPDQPDYRILVVDDQREDCLLLQRLLERAGFQVQVAENGLQAINAFGAWLPHFIWIDLRMPVLSGLEAAKRIRALQGGGDVKIVALTASAFDSQREEVLGSGFDDFLRKPYRPAEIFKCMARHLGVRYIHEVTPREAEARHPGTLHADVLAALPAALRAELENALISLDPKRIALAAGQITEQDATLGRALSGLIGRFAYTPILHALQSAKGQFARTSA